MKIGHDGGATGDPADLLRTWTNASLDAAAHLGARPVELTAGEIDGPSVRAVNTALIVAALHGGRLRENIAARVRMFSVANAAGTAGRDGGASLPWASRPGAADRGLLIVLVAAAGDLARREP